MSNRNLMHYFSPHATKPTEMMGCDGIPGDLPETSAKSVTKRPRTSKVKPIVVDDEDDDDFDNDSLFLPRTTQPGNASITKYFSRVDREAATNKSSKKSKPCVMTVEAQVHGSPPKKGSKIHTVKKAQKKKKRKLGIPSAIADTIELISSEELVTTESSPSPEVMDSVQLLEPQPSTPKSQWKMKICLSSNVKVSDDDVEDSKIQEGPRRSTRVRVRPERIQNEPAEVECKNVPLKKRKKGEKKMKEDDDDLEIIAEDIAPIFLKKKLEDEARAMKKAKQEFLFSGVPEVLKQQTAALVALELRPVEIFPKISHVTQAGSQPWRLPFPDRLSRLLRKSHPHSKINRPTAFSSNLNSSNVDISSSSNRSISLKQAPYLEWRYCKDWITRLKEDYSLSFPFFRTLRTLLPRTNKEDDGSQHLPWTDAYAPKHSNDILTNNRGSSLHIKNWLNQWKSRAGEEITTLPKKKAKKVGKRKRISSDCTDSEEAVVEESSNASWNPEEQLCNCILLVGPPGCGKTATIYALAEELGYNVLEVNASSRRNGKTVLSHLHEATQSHSLNNNSNAVTNSMEKLFFGGGKSAVKASRPETKTALSLVLFEDVDIVFESEDESFYNALTTLIQTSKRPIVLTLGSTEERALTLIQDKIKSYFDIVYFLSPDTATACGYLWSVSLAEGYPLEWKALENWVGSRGVMNLDLRSLLLKLQFLLQSHPLRLKLNFSQLQLKNDEEGACCNGGRSWGSSSNSSDTIPVQLIELPLFETLSEWPYASAPRSLRFTYDADSDAILMTDSKAKKRFSRILSNDSLVDPDAVEETIEGDEEPLSKTKRHSDNGHSAETTEFHTPPSTPEKDSKTQRPRQRIPYVYFALFDGHAGTGAAISAANELHCILHDKLMDVIHHLLPPTDTGECAQNGRNQVLWFPEREISVESFIVGALEATFHEMDNLIAEDRFVYRVTGGCTVVVSLFICGKLFVSNAGDSRAVLCRGRKAFPLSNDFTPETERQRIRKLAALQPELLGGEYTALDFSRRPNRRDIGQRLLYREPHMTGWAYKTVTPEDLKFPVVYGEGKRSRVLATIGVTRGFGDHDLRAPNSNILIKPFLSSQPEVRIVDIEKEAIYETDVLVMGTDGLWDVTSNERVAETVQRSLEQFPIEDSARYRYRFTSAAQDLVMCSRGKLNERSWRTADSKSATIDDISVFVIPLAAYKEEYLRWKLEMESQTVRPETKEADIPVSEPAASLPTVTVASQPARMTEQPANVNSTPAENETALSDPSVDAVNVEKDEGIVVMEEEAVGPPPSEGAVDPLQLPADPEKNESNS